MSELFSNEQNRKEKIKSIIKRIHQGESIDTIKREFGDLLKSVRPDEISRIEEELIKEGLPREEIQKLCAVHLEMFRDAIAGAPRLAPEGHPIYILMEEHKYLQDTATKINGLANELTARSSFEEAKEILERLGVFVGDLKESESHYVREENVLFPYLERHGITQPPAIMWMEHQTIRETKKKLYALYEKRNGTSFAEFAKQITAVSVELAELLSSHFFKENNILFPTSMRLFTTKEWEDVREGFDEIGYPRWSPGKAKAQTEKVPAQVAVSQTGSIELETGSINIVELEAILNAVPFDITFVDAEDKVRYFNQTKERAFPRTKAVIGRTVQNCHPQKSIHIVNQILEEFKTGKRDVAEFWINKDNRLIYIRYFPVKDRSGRYLGCIEVTQDVSEIKKLEGEKRLL